MSRAKMKECEGVGYQVSGARRRMAGKIYVYLLWNKVYRRVESKSE